MVQLCGYPNLPQIYFKSTWTTYAQLESDLINYFLIYSYPSQLILYADFQQEFAIDSFTHRSYRQICSKFIHMQNFNKNP